MNEKLFIVVDLFCGAGGTTTGFDTARLASKLYSQYYVGSDYKENGFEKFVEVIACVNHDPIAIKSHWRNHPNVRHFEEDIRTLDLTALVELVESYRKRYPNAYLILWASLECTNFSIAKGGQPRDADSRTLADHLERYVIALKPDYIQIENVVEFKSWGPLDGKGKPVSRKNGSDWLRWRKVIKSHGYVDDWTELNSANFGAHTSRNRLFGCFARPWLPIIFPEPTHAKKPSSRSMYGDLQKWRAVKEVLNFEDEGESIFNRKKPLSDKTLERIYAGLIKFVANGNTSFISKYFSGKQQGQSIEQPAGAITTIDHHALVNTIPFIVQRNSGLANSKIVSIEGPARTLTTTGGNLELVQPKFLLKYNSVNKKTGKHVPPSIEDPAPVISCRGGLGLVTPEFLTSYYGAGFNTSVNNPSPTVTTKDRAALIQPKYYLSSQNQSVDQPAGAILTNDKHRLIQAQPFVMPTNYDNKPKSIDEPAPTITANRKHHYLVNPSWFGNPQSIEQPCPVIVARQDKAPLYLVEVEGAPVSIPVYEDDTQIMIAIKQFMVVYGLADIKMRMLRVLELLKIQGFPHDYILEGSQADQKKFIGNSVVPLVVKSWIEALATRIIERGIVRSLFIDNQQVA